MSNEVSVNTWCLMSEGTVGDSVSRTYVMKVPGGAVMRVNTYIVKSKFMDVYSLGDVTEALTYIPGMFDIVKNTSGTWSLVEANHGE